VVEYVRLSNKVVRVRVSEKQTLTPVTRFTVRYRLNLEGRQAIQHGIDIGRGGIWLELTEEQYAKLRKR
jgi:hypothetical protein